MAPRPNTQNLPPEGEDGDLTGQKVMIARNLLSRAVVSSLSPGSGLVEVSIGKRVSGARSYHCSTSSNFRFTLSSVFIKSQQQGRTTSGGRPPPRAAAVVPPVDGASSSESNSEHADTGDETDENGV